MPTINRLPSQLTYNDLNGREAVEILTNWFQQLLSTRPELQPHLTLPNARIGLVIGVSIDMFVGGTVPVASPPDKLEFGGQVVLDNQAPGGEPVGRAEFLKHVDATLEQIINVAPIAGGKVPDQVRADHDLPIGRPGYGPRDTGSHLFIADIVEQTDRNRGEERQSERAASARAREQDRERESPTGGREGIVAEGYQFSSEPASASVSVHATSGIEQTIPMGGRGKIEIDLTGEGKLHDGGTIVKLGTMDVASAKSAGDQRGAEYGAVSGTYDAGPAGLARPNRGGGGLYSDGRSRISFGNKH
jgi:hypothetical protein